MDRPMYVQPQSQSWMIAVDCQQGGCMSTTEILTGLAVVKLQVAHRVLLISYACTSRAAIERKVRHEATAPLLNKQTDVYDIRSGRHVKDDVLKTRGLRSRPMHTRRGLVRRDCGGIDDKVAHLAEEDIDSFPVQVLCIVRVSVDEPKAFKVAGGLERRWVGGIADELSEIGRLDRTRDLVCASWKVHQPRGSRR